MSKIYALRPFLKGSVTSLAFLTGFMFSPVLADETVQIPSEDETEIQVLQEDTTVLYGEEFFDRFPNAQNAADLVNRIPGGRQAMGDGGGGRGSRGFSNNNDGVLINGRRITGKGNNSRGVLGRISKDQVAHIELIRGGSPDIKSASQSSMINVVTKEDTSQGSGTWQAKVRTTETGHARPGGSLNYAGKNGALEYFLSGQVEPESRDGNMQDSFFDANDILTEFKDFENLTRQTRLNFSGNMAYEMEGGSLFRFNGSWRGGARNFRREG